MKETQTPIYKINSIKTAQSLSTQPMLQHAFIRINNICNARCEFCDVWKSSPEDHHQGINWENIIDSLIFLAPLEVNIHGGESFLSKSFFEILKYANSRLSFSITTNGRFFIQKNIDFIVQYGVKRIYLSIDHYNSELNAKSRGIQWLAKNLDSAIKKISDDCPHIQLIVNHVVSAYNIDSIDLFLKKMKQLGVDSVNLIPIKDYPQLFINQKQIHSFYHKIDNMIVNGEISKNFFTAGRYKIFGEPEYWLEAEKGIYNTGLKVACIIPAAVLFIDGVSGNVYPCDTTMYREESEQYVMGNVLKEYLIDIWNGVKFHEFRNKMYPKITCGCIHGCDPANILPTM